MVITLETKEERMYSDLLSNICIEAQEGNRQAQNFLKKLWKENWKSILKKLNTDGSVWYVWWMDGVRELMKVKEPIKL